jgi:hypothetical protein
MKYSVLSSLEYGSGRALLLCSRFSDVNSGFSMPVGFLRRCLEWVSSSSESEPIRVAVVVNGVDDGSVGVIDNTPNVSVSRRYVKDLSDISLFDDIDCVVIHGLRNDFSPLVRNNLKQCISSGCGVLFSDVNVDESSVDMFEDMSPVYSIGSGVNLGYGYYSWTEEGISSHLYLPEFSGLVIPIMNTVSELGLGYGWSVLYSYDTSLAPILPPRPVTIETAYSSSDYDIPGANMMAYFSAVYENGVIKLEE